MTTPDTPSSRALTALNAFVVLYGVDFGLTAIDESLAAAGHGQPLAPVRIPVGFAALIASVLVYGWMAFSARLPRAILVPPILVNLWIALGALPFPVTAPESAGLIAAAAQGAGALYLLLRIRHATGGRALLVEETLAGPRFRLASSLRFLAGNAVLVPSALLALVLFTVTRYVEIRTHGFISFDRGGVNIAARRYVRGDHVIRLVGMMHIGERASYTEVFQSFSTEDTVVLAEGVTDDDQRLAHFGYGPVAESLGLEVQPAIEEVLGELDPDEGPGCDEPPAAREWPHVERTDLDVRDFDPETIDLLNRMGRIWNEPDRRGQLRELVALATDPAAQALLPHFDTDLIDKRNRHLLEGIETALRSYHTIVVPWGGLHLPWIESRIKTWGFTLERSEEQRLLSYATIFSAPAPPLDAAR